MNAMGMPWQLKYAKRRDQNQDHWSSNYRAWMLAISQG